ncbi:MAG: hypothetical protein QOJ07_1982 [Thermoleophilaceae bacterium]|nr:hypothetical protein [Thermoleophilaceae bacterium]
MPADRQPPRAPVALQVLAALATIALLLAGLWVFGSPLSGAVADALGVSRYWSSIAFAVVWFVLASFALGKLRKERPAFRLPLRAAFVATALAAGGVLAWSSLHDTTVHEDVATADVKASDLPVTRSRARGQARARPRNVELSSGKLSGIGHEASGEARVIQLAKGGRRLTLTRFSTENAPDLRLYMATGEVHGDVGEHREIARLKGNRGDQQYSLPGSLDLGRYDTVVIWCKAFAVGVAQAPLHGS